GVESRGGVLRDLGRRSARVAAADVEAAKPEALERHGGGRVGIERAREGCVGREATVGRARGGGEAQVLAERRDRRGRRRTRRGRRGGRRRDGERAGEAVREGVGQCPERGALLGGAALS